ncbi:MAG: right-handed parallel beta-helix repeat-containing protein, partial [Elusimicrobiota bacterium]
MLKKIGIPVLISFLGIESARAATYYVATNGSDSNPGTVAAPFRSIQRPANIVSAGDRVLIRAGRYPAFSLTSKKGTSAAPIVFESYPGETAVVDRHLGGGNGYRGIEFNKVCAHIIIDRLEITDSNPLIDTHKNCDVINNTAACVALFEASAFSGRNGIKINSSTTTPTEFITLKNLTIHHNSSQAILGGGRNHRILNNHIYNNGVISEGYGMYITGDGHLIMGNRSHDNNGHGIRTGTDGGPKGYITNSVIEGNITYNNTRPFIHYRNFTEPVLYRDGGHGIVLWHGHGNIIRNNIIYGNGSTGIWLNGDHPYNNQVYNNTIYGNRRGGVYVYYEGQVNVFRNNIVVANGSTYGQLNLRAGNNSASHNLVTEPAGFVNAAARDFRLLSGSP